jgi:hypothetical protein
VGVVDVDFFFNFGERGGDDASVEIEEDVGHEEKEENASDAAFWFLLVEEGERTGGWVCRFVGELEV